MIIDAFAFAQSRRTSGGLAGSTGGGSEGGPEKGLGGHFAVADLQRLVQDLPAEQPGHVQWHLLGRMRAGRAYLDVRARGVVRVICQRCLEPFDFALALSRTLGFVANGAELDALDALDAAGQGDGIEYLVADRHLDVQELIEDELILALPFAPMHEGSCAGAAVGDTTDGDRSGAASPFAGLMSLRKH